MISLYQAPGRHRSWRVAGPVLLAAVLATGCSAASRSSTPSSGSSRSSGGPGSSSFRQCLQKHGVSLPNFGGSGSGRPPTPSGRPTPGARPGGGGFGGANSAKFRKAIQACGGFGGGGGFPGGGFGGSAPPG
jgi:translation initiation factor IF-2